MQRSNSFSQLLTQIGNNLPGINENEPLLPPPALHRQSADNWNPVNQFMDAIEKLQRQVHNQQIMLEKLVRITQANNHCVRDLHHDAKIKRQQKQQRQQVDFLQTTGYELGDYSPTRPGY